MGVAKARFVCWSACGASVGIVLVRSGFAGIHQMAVVVCFLETAVRWRKRRISGSWCTEVFCSRIPSVDKLVLDCATACGLLFHSPSFSLRYAGMTSTLHESR